MGCGSSTADGNESVIVERDEWVPVRDGVRAAGRRVAPGQRRLVPGPLAADPVQPSGLVRGRGERRDTGRARGASGFSSSNYPRFDVNPNHGRAIATATVQDFVKAHQTIQHAASSPSYLELQVLPAAGVPAQDTEA
jgi:predicted acyl esterase